MHVRYNTSTKDLEQIPKTKLIQYNSFKPQATSGQIA